MYLILTWKFFLAIIAAAGNLLPYLISAFVHICLAYQIKTLLLCHYTVDPHATLTCWGKLTESGNLLPKQFLYF